MNQGLKLPPIYTKAYKFHLDLYKTSAKFPKYYRPSLGQRLETTSLDLTIKIRTAILSKNTVQMKKLMHHIDGLKVTLQTCFDLGIIGIGRFSLLSKEVSEISAILMNIEKI